MRHVILIQIVIFAYYVFYVAKRYGILSSISSSWYRLPFNRWWMFSAFTFGVGIPAVLIAQYTGNVFYGYSGSLICFCGVAGAFKFKKIVSVIHNFGAMGSIIVGCAALAIDGWWISSALVVGSALALRLIKVRNYTWWLEISSFASIAVGLWVVAS